MLNDREDMEASSFEIPENIPKKKKKLRLLLLFLLISAVIAGGFGVGVGVGNYIKDRRANRPKVFNKKGLSVTLNASFEEDEEGVHDYTGEKISVDITFEKADERTKNMTAQEYRDAHLSAIGAEEEMELINDEGLAGFCYTYRFYNEELYFYADFVYKGSDGFYSLLFSCYERNREELYGEILRYAGSAEVY